MESVLPKRKRGRPRKQPEESVSDNKRVTVELRKEDIRGEKWIICMGCQDGISGLPGVIIDGSAYIVLCATCMLAFSCYHCDELAPERTTWYFGGVINSCKACALQVLRDLEKEPKRTSRECVVCKNWDQQRTVMMETKWGHVCARCVPRCKEKLADLE